MIPISRRTFLKQGAALASIAALRPWDSLSRATTVPGLTNPAEIEVHVKAARPLLGGAIPADLANTLGLTHYDGHYHLTNKPFLIEGAEAIHRLGMNVAKFWLREDKLPGYGYNSNWGIPLNGSLVETISHPYFVEALSQPFKTVMLEVFPLMGSKGNFFEGENQFTDEEEQFHQLTSYLLKTYAERDIVFVLQHWEGDWMLRRAEGGTWQKVPADEVQRRCNAFTRWLSARQRGVESARKEAGPSMCRVYHAAEVNRVWDSAKGIPTLTTHVLPHVTLDLVSWSCYDGIASAVSFWQGIEIIRNNMRPSPTFGKNAVYIGEIGVPEQKVTREYTIETWDRCMGVAIAMGLPWVVHWELYCNEPRDAATKEDRRPRKAEELNGYWFIRPDGSLSHSGRYLSALLQNAGKSLPADTIRSLRSAG